MRHVLVVQLARFGDIVQTKRFLLTVAAYENTTIHLCVADNLSALAAKLYPFAHIVPIPAHATQTKDPVAIFTAAKTCFATLASINFSSVYTLNASSLSFAISRLFPPEIVHGYKNSNGQNLRDKWFTLAARITADRASAPINLVDLWAHLLPNPIAPACVNPVARMPKTHRIGIVMAGRASRRSLPSAVLATCLQAIFKARGGPELVCLGSNAERPLVRQVSRLLPAPIVQKLVDKTGKTSLLDLFELLPSFDCLITPDTGTMHLAAHLGVPVQAFFLSSAWCFETGPYGLGHKIWQTTTSCGPCLESRPCPHDVLCLNAFSDSNFIEHLSGNHTEIWPQFLTGYISQLDTLGTTYIPVDGENVKATKRNLLRRLLVEHCIHEPLHQLPATAGELLYQEADWMLP